MLSESFVWKPKTFFSLTSATLLSLTSLSGAANANQWPL
ncbi:hypothetical protein PanWU01x14_234560 [Parasponia andersonii]|uniref:Uncharacterized protein n=1 Tax=Parasponia andersonii TaxID=3476 RepID=A0A2P5BJ08_PARAD|nr:hypothetical protein PanWU01x14_234560 [Parasponia andersonii]